MPKVSIIIPNYNHAPYLKQRIDSVLAQTLQDIEVIILDDCSPDHSREIIKEYAPDPRVRLAFNEQNSGCLFKQWNKGLKMAAGEYVWIAESDDYADPAFLETLVGCLEADPGVGVAYCDSFRVCNGEVKLAREAWYGEFAHLYSQDFKANGKEYVAQRMLFKTTIPNASAAVFRRALAGQVGGADESFILSSDQLFWIKLLERSNLAYFATPLNYYRYHEKTARHSNLTNGVMLEEACRISLYVLDNFPVPLADSKAARDRLTGWFFYMIAPGHSSIPPERRRNIERLVCTLNPYARLQRWFIHSGLQWLWLGCRRRVSVLWGRVFPRQAGLF